MSLRKCITAKYAFFPPTIVDFGRFDVRLFGGLGNFEGRLELHYQGSWGSVCSTGLDDKIATVACKELGFHAG